VGAAFLRGLVAGEPPAAAGPDRAQDEPDAVTSARDSDEVTETGVPGRLQTVTIVPEGYRWAGAKLVPAAHRQTTIHGTAQSPRLARYQEVSCGSLDPARGEL
jgi:hypothetical protein